MISLPKAALKLRSKENHSSSEEEELCSICCLCWSVCIDHIDVLKEYLIWLLVFFITVHSFLIQSILFLASLKRRQIILYL